MRRLVVIAVLIGVGTLASAQSVTFKEYGQREGLENLAIRGILQDRTGFLWISTENGLFRYDGSRFVAYGRKEGLENPFVISAHLDSRGIFWAGTPTGVFFLKNDRFRPLVGGAKSLEMDDASSITSTRAGEVLINAMHDLYSVEPAGDGWSVLPYEARHPQVPGNLRINSILATASEGVWTGCDQGICQTTDQGFRKLGVHDGVPGDRYIALAEDGAGNLWARGDRHVLERRAGSSVFRDASAGFLFDPRNASNAALIQDPSGRILTPALRGIARFNGKSWDRIDPSRGLPDSNITQLFVDREGIVWVGSHGRGLFKWLGYGDWEHWSTPQGIRDPSVFAVAIDRQKRIWVGNGDTIDVSDSGRQKFRPFARPLPPHLVGLQSAVSDLDGSIWFGDFSGVLLHIHPESNTYETVKVAYGVHKIFIDSSDTLWAITRGGLYSIPAAPHGQSKPVLDDSPLLKRARLRDITEAPDKTLWLGTASGLFHRTAGLWHRVQMHNEEVGGFISLVAVSTGGQVWVAGKFGGVARLRVENDTVGAVQIFTTPTLSSEYVNGIAIDRRGWVWIINDQGIDLLQSGRWRHFDQDEGLLWNDTNEGALLLASDGSAWIGTSAGLSHLVYPDTPSTVRPLTTTITDAFWGSHQLDPAAKSSLPWQSGDLKVNFAVFSYRNEGAISFRYRLVGLEEDWVSTRDRSVRYPKLPPGKYRFEVISADSGLHRVSPPAVLSFEVTPPWWRTPTAWGLLGIGIVFLVALLLRWRLRSLLERQKRLEKLVAERTHALQAERRELLATREVLRQQATRDGLTGLLNRTAILEVLDREWKRADRERGGLAVIIADVDHFKQFNDTFGHLVGDEILSAIATRLKDAVREYDAVGRYGGEEFLIVLTGWSREGGEERLTHLWQSVCAAPLRVGQRTVLVTSSFGMAGFSAGDEATSVNDLLILADQALYRAKAQGRNRIELSPPAGTYRETTIVTTGEGSLP
ncbi:MAG TPA: diguanylate cyclase [Acidisarcina sp.]|nr:diguanylate cyclase [Acidisarcina sp.]